MKTRLVIAGFVVVVAVAGLGAWWWFVGSAEPVGGKLSVGPGVSKSTFGQAGNMSQASRVSPAAPPAGGPAGTDKKEEKAGETAVPPFGGPPPFAGPQGAAKPAAPPSRVHPVSASAGPQGQSSVTAGVLPGRERQPPPLSASSQSSPAVSPSSSAFAGSPKVGPVAGVERDAFRGTSGEAIRLSEESQRLDNEVEVEKKRLELDKLRLERTKIGRELKTPESGKGGGRIGDVADLLVAEKSPVVRSVALSGGKTIALLERGGQTVVAEAGKKVWGYKIVSVDFGGVSAEKKGEQHHFPVTAMWETAAKDASKEAKESHKGSSLSDSAAVLEGMMQRPVQPPPPGGSSARRSGY